MKKILSMLVIAALLLAALCVSVSAGTYFDRNSAISYKDAKFQVRKANVTIDGVISAGEYDEFTGHCEWWIGEMASGAFDDATKMAETVKWYFSWDGNKYFNVAVVYDPGQGSVQTYPAGDHFGDYNAKDAGTIENIVIADDFLGWGPGMQIVSNEQSAKYPEWSRLCYTIGKNSVDGGYITGTYSDQNGQPDSPYKAVGGTDFEVVYNGSVVTIEWKIPIYQLKADFVEGSATTNFKASLTVGGGFYTADLAAEDPTASAANHSYGVRMGMLGYNSDSTTEDKGHATFLLTKNDIPQVDVPTTGTTEAPVQDPTQGTTEPPVQDPTTGTTEAPVQDPTTGTTEAPVQDPTTGTTVGGENDPIVTPDPEVPGEEKPGDDKPAVNDKPVDTKPTTPNNGQDAAQTGDPMIIAAVVSAISACGVMIAKKRK